MKPTHQHACPRCFQALTVGAVNGGKGHRVTLICSEPYCDYVLVIHERDAAPARRWSWPQIAWLRRAAS
jgi:hypothetical protein